MMTNTFQYIPYEYEGEWGKEKSIRKIIQNIEYLFLVQLGKPKDNKECFRIKDPDGTFLLVFRPQERIFVVLNEGEMRGYCTFWYSYKSGVVSFNPGPWIKRIELMIMDS